MSKEKTKKIVVILMLAGFFFLISSLYISKQNSSALSVVNAQLATQTKTLNELAETIDRDGADSSVSAIVRDCNAGERERFDQLLADLASLQRIDLQEVSYLFSACGDFYAERRAVMVMKLDREFSIYQNLVTLKNLFNSKSAVADYPVETWSELVEIEKQRSQFLNQLVDIQGSIITNLLDNVPVSSSKIKDLLMEAQTVKSNLSSLGETADVVRIKLNEL